MNAATLRVVLMIFTMFLIVWTWQPPCFDNPISMQFAIAKVAFFAVCWFFAFWSCLVTDPTIVTNESEKKK